MAAPEDMPAGPRSAAEDMEVSRVLRSAVPAEAIRGAEIVRSRGSSPPARCGTMRHRASAPFRRHIRRAVDRQRAGTIAAGARLRCRAVTLQPDGAEAPILLVMGRPRDQECGTQYWRGRC